MRIFFILLLSFFALAAQAQKRPDQQPTKVPEATDAIYTQEGNGTIPAGEIRKIKFDKAREYFLAKVNSTCISAAPPALASSSVYKGQILTVCSNNYKYYIDGDGRSTLIYTPGGAGGGAYTSGTGINISGLGVITNTGDTDASNDVEAGDAAGGDLSGTYPNPSVVKIYGRALSALAPSTNQVIKWNGSAWAPAADATNAQTFTDGATIDFTTTGINTSAEVIDNSISTVKIQNSAVTLAKLAQNGASTNQVIKWNGSAWVPGTDDGGLTAGESTTVTDGATIDFTLTGADITAEVKNAAITTAKLADASVTAAKLAQNSATTGQVMKWNGSAWAAAADDTGVANWVWQSVSTSIGSPVFVVSGTVPADLTRVRVYRNGMEYRVGATGASDINVAYDSGTNQFTLSRAYASGEQIKVQIK